MTGSRIRIGLAGATGAVGQEILRVMEGSALPVESIVPQSSEGGTTHRIRWRDEEYTVGFPSAEALAECDVAILALPMEPARALVDPLLDQDVAVLDLSGVLFEKEAVPRVVSWVNPGELDRFGDFRAVSCPPPAVVALAVCMAPFRRDLGAVRCRGVLWHGAGVRGKAGIEELARQTVALFNQAEAPDVHYPTGLAFNLLPSNAPPSPDGWSAEEHFIALLTGGLLGLPRSEIGVTTMTAPWFSALGASLHLLSDRPVSRSGALEILAEAPGVHLVTSDRMQDLPRPRSCEDPLALHVARIREDPAGEGIHLWAVADELRWGVGANVVGILRHLVEDAWI